MIKTIGVQTIRCGKCFKHKDSTAFRRSNTISRGYQSYCKECQRTVFQEWREKNRAKVNEDGKRRQAEKRRFVQSLKNKPCVDCGLSWPPYLMHFDHLRDKEFTLGGGQGASPSKERILAEAAKCEIRCVLCHAEKTYGKPLACAIQGGRI